MNPAAPSPKPIATLSVIVRSHEGVDLALLDEALFSIAMAHKRLADGTSLSIQTVLVTQVALEAPSAALQSPGQLESSLAEADVHRLLEQHTSLGGNAFDPAPSLHPCAVSVALPNPDQRDLRSQALNAGLAQATGRYIAFLDYDDVVYPHAYALLVAQLQNGLHCLAAGGVVRSEIAPSPGGFVILKKTRWLHWGSKQSDLLQSNFLPLHSFVVDRQRVPIADALWFDPSLTRLEDYDFLLRLGAVGSFDLSKLDVDVCEYRLRSRSAGHALETRRPASDPKPGTNAPAVSEVFAASNVNPLSNRSAENLLAWRAARLHVAQLKQQVSSALTEQAVRSVPAPSAQRLGRALSLGQWWRAAQVSIDQSGGLLALLLRVWHMLRSQGVRGLWVSALSVARRAGTKV